MRVSIATALLILTDISGSFGCSLENTTKIDWSRLTGLWFNTIATDDPWSHVPKCRLIGVRNYTDDEVGFLIHAIPRNGTSNVADTYRQKCLSLYDGIYLPTIDPDMEDVKMTIDKEHISGDPSALELILIKQKDFFMAPVSFKTDYETYIIEEQCRAVVSGLQDGEEEKVAWIFTSVHNPAKKDVNHLMELAKKAGVEKELHETDCHETNPSEFIVTE